MTIKARTVKVLENCDLCDDKEATIHLPLPVESQIYALSEAMGADEWIGYLFGTYENENHVAHITHMEIPDQEVSGASCEATPPDDPKLIGTVHSHHNMGTFFSSADDIVTGHHPITMVYSNTGGISGRIRAKLPCGNYKALKATVQTELPPTDEAWVTEAKKHIKKHEYKFDRNTQQHYLPWNMYEDYLYQPSLAHNSSPINAHNLSAVGDKALKTGVGKILQIIKCPWCDSMFNRELGRIIGQYHLCPECSQAWADSLDYNCP